MKKILFVSPVFGKDDNIIPWASSYLINKEWLLFIMLCEGNGSKEIFMSYRNTLKMQYMYSVAVNRFVVGSIPTRGNEIFI